MALTVSVGLSDQDFKALVVKIKSANKGQDVAADLGLTMKRGRAFCPECQSGGGKTPDLVVGDGGFKCWKCGMKGDVIKLVEVISGKSTADAIAYLAGRAGIAWDRGATRGGCQGQGSSSKSRPRATSAVNPPCSGPILAEDSHQSRPAPERSASACTPSSAAVSVTSRPKPAAPIPTKIIDPSTRSSLYVAFLSTVCKSLTGTPGAAYLESRGIRTGTAAALGVRYCADLSSMWNLTDRATIKAAGLTAFYSWQKSGVPFIVFPYIRAGAVVYLKGRCLLSKADADSRAILRFMNTGGKVPCLWNHDAITGAPRVLVAEGEVDALTAIEAGQVGVGLPGWSHWKDEWTADFKGKDVVLVMDADKGGDQGTWDIARRFLKAGQPTPRQIILPDGEDLNSYFLKSMKG